MAENPLEELRKYAEADGTEMGEDCLWLLNCEGRAYLSSDFHRAAEAEIRAMLDWYQKNTEIRETVEVQKITVMELIEI